MADTPMYEPVPADYQAPAWIGLTCRGLALVIFLGIVYAAYHGHWLLAGFMAWFSSHGVAIVLRCFKGGHSLCYVFNPKEQSWAFLADVLLAVGVSALAYGIQFLDQHGWHREWRWLLPVLAAMYMVGLIAGHVFSVNDRKNYIRQGGAALLGDPWKQWHDKGTYTIYVASIFALLVIVASYAVTWQQHSWILVVMLVAGSIWAYGGIVHDGKGLNIFKLHDAANYRTSEYEPGFRLRRLAA